MDTPDSKVLRLLGAKLQSNRQKQGVKQEYIAKQLHVHKSTVSRLENGHENVSLVFLLKYCGAVGIHACNIIEEMEEIIQNTPLP